MLVFIILFPFVYALVYGNASDHEAVSIATVLLVLMSLACIAPIHDSLQASIITIGYASFLVFAALVVSFIYVGRSNRRYEYQTVSNGTEVA